jgi:hypothetical protein
MLLICNLIIAQTNLLQNTGNVGINTLAPTMPLDVNGDANIGNVTDRFRLRISSSLFPEIRFKTPTDDEVIRLGVAVGIVPFPTNDGDFYVYTAATGTMPLVVKKNGNVSMVATSGSTGIGIKDPLFKLNVAEDLSMSGDIDVGQIGISGSTDNAKRMVMGYDVNGAGFGYIKAGWYQHQWTNLSLQPNGGNVGIGTTSPSEKLSINGKIRAHEIKVETANWPDYVFTKNYHLPTLQETEKHIKEKRHLPGIPSAEEVKANGIDLGEMNAKLLQKIEELTLHLIEMNKKAEHQQLDINYLKSKLK